MSCFSLYCIQMLILGGLLQLARSAQSVKVLVCRRPVQLARSATCTIGKLIRGSAFLH